MSSDLLTREVHFCKLLKKFPEFFNISEKIFNKIIFLCAFAILLLLGGIFITLFIYSLDSIKKIGLQFFVGKTWDPMFGEFGALAFLTGTLLTSFLSLAICVPFSMSIAIFVGEYYPRGMLASIFKGTIELLAGIPSVVYGFWGLFVLVPLIRSIEMHLGIEPYGVGIMTASLILSLMIIPYSASLGTEVMALVPSDLKEAALSMGATRFEVIRKVIVPYARSGIFAGILLALGRAIGETMAVTMVIGNTNAMPKNIFSPSNTMASVIANEFTEATDTLYLSSLIEVGLLLFVVTVVINIIGRYVIKLIGVKT